MSSYSFDVLKIRDFRILIITRMFAAMALQAQSIIVGWQVYSLTKSPFILGLTGLAEAVPAISCAFISGHIVDTGRPYRVFIICLLALALNMISFFLVGGSVISVPHSVLVPYIFMGIFFSGIARSFIIPSNFSLLSQVVPREKIPSASAWLTSGFQVGIISGPAVAGLLYGGYGPRIAWLLPLSLMSIAFLRALMMSPTNRLFRNTSKREPILTSIREGWKFIFSTKLLLCIMSLDMFAVLFGGAVSMLPAYADQVLHIGSEGLGLLRAAPALGAVAMALWFAGHPMKIVRGKVLLVVVAGFGVCIIVFGFSSAFLLSMFCLALSGAFDSVSMLIRQTLVQWLTPSHMRGRISSVNSMFIISSNEIGAFESGTAAHIFGLVPSIVLGGIGTLIVVAVTAIVFPRLKTTAIAAETENAK